MIFLQKKYEKSIFFIGSSQRATQKSTSICSSLFCRCALCSTPLGVFPSSPSTPAGLKRQSARRHILLSSCHSTLHAQARAHSMPGQLGYALANSLTHIELCGGQRSSLLAQHLPTLEDIRKHMQKPQGMFPDGSYGFFRSISQFHARQLSWP